MWGGLLVSMAAFSIALPNLLGDQPDMGGAYNNADPGLRTANDTLITLIVIILMFGYIISLYAHYSNPVPAKPPRD